MNLSSGGSDKISPLVKADQIIHKYEEYHKGYSHKTSVHTICSQEFTSTEKVRAEMEKRLNFSNILNFILLPVFFAGHAFSVVTKLYARRMLIEI